MTTAATPTLTDSTVDRGLDRAADDADVEFDEFDLDVSIVETGKVVEGLMRNTDDNCGHTCPRACINSG